MAERLALVRFDLLNAGTLSPGSDGAFGGIGETADLPPVPAEVTVPDETPHCVPVEDASDAAVPVNDAPGKRVSEMIERLAQDLAPLREAAVEASARAFGQAAAAAIPHLVQTGFAAEIAQASLDIARAQPPGGPLLQVSQDDLETVRACLAEAADGLDLRASPSLGPGQATLEWTDGGARFDADALTAAALELLHQHLPKPKTKEPPE